MSVSITAPQSRVIPRGTTRIAWTSTYPQSAYEILYREVGTTAWQTFGRVTSTAQYVDLDVSRLTDFKEYHFRVVVWSVNSTSGTTIYNGSDKSLAYSMIVTPKNKLADMKARYGDKMVEVPVYLESNAETSTRVAMGDGKIGVCPIVPVDSAAASEHRIEHPVGHRAFADDNPVRYTYSYVPQETYVRQDVRNTQYSYYVATKYDKTYYAGYYLSGYSAKYNATYYRGYYSYTSTVYATYYRGYYQYYGPAYGYYITGYYRQYQSVYYYTDYGSYQTQPATYGTYTKYGRSCSGHVGTYGPTSYYKTCYPQVERYYSTANGGYYGYRYLSTYYCRYDAKYSYYTYCVEYSYSEKYTISSAKYSTYSYKTSGGGGSNTYPQYSRYYYQGMSYAQYYGYYHYTGTTYGKYYGYYRYYSPYYSIYYNYYRYYTYYKATYYTYTTTYRYA